MTSRRPLGLASLVAVALVVRTVPAVAQGGFAETQIATQLDSPVAMAIAPDGRVFLAQQGGDVRVIAGDTLLATPFVHVPTTADDEEGLLGIAFDPSFATNGFVYVTYTVTSPTRHNRIARYTANGNVAVPGSAVVLFDLDDNVAHFHVGGALRFAADGTLLTTTGDNANGANGQSLTTTHGKMLRLAADGSIPPTNPFYGTLTGKHRAIWAYGFRNAFTFDVQPATGRVFINDVGDADWEEVNEGVAGGNYGWPNVEGPAGLPAFRDPVHAYDHSHGCAITGGAFYDPPATQFPSQYVGKYFYGEYCANEIRVVDPASPAAYAVFRPTITPGPVDLRVAPDGSLWVLARGNSNVDGGSGVLTGILSKITYTGSDAPSIAAQPQDQLVSVGQTATFSVTANGAAPLAYQWQRNAVDIPGATADTYTTPPATLADDGALFRCVVTNASGNVASEAARLAVTTDQPPVVTIDTPAAGAHYDAGELLAFAGSATDPETGPLGAAAFSWRIDFHHASHTHPGLPLTPGIAAGTFPIPNVGEVSTNVFFRVVLSARDPAGLTTTVVRDVLPNTTTLGVDTVPPGLAVLVDSQPETAPVSTPSVVGMTRTLGVVSPQTAGGVTYAFTGWSDGGAASHALATPATDTTYTATFAPAAALAVTQLVCKVRFDVTGRDRCIVRGLLPDLPAGVALAGRTLAVDVGGAQVVFTLDARGRAKAPNGSASLTPSPTGGPAKLRATLGLDSWSDELADEGVDPVLTVTDRPGTAGVTVAFDGAVSAATVPTLYRGKAQRRGRLALAD